MAETPVPYSGVPDVQAEARPIEPRRLDVPIGAFGGYTAQAISGLGQTVSGAGKEIADRGIAMQQLYQASDAMKAASDFSTQAGQAYSNFATLSGKNAVDQLQPFMDSINSMREGLATNLSPYGRLMYDQDTRFLQARFMVGAGLHAGEQNKQYMLDASNARNDAADNLVMAAPTDDAIFDHALNVKQTELQHQAQILGWSPDALKEQTLEQTSDLRAHKIQGLAQQQPFAAQGLLDKWSQANLLTGDDAARLSDYIGKIRNTVGARNESAAIFAGNGNSFGDHVLPLAQAQAAIGGVESTNNYDADVKLIHTGGPLKGQSDEAIGRYQVLASNLPAWLNEAGMAPMTVAQFKSDHDAQDQLFNFKFGQYMDQTGSFNGAANLWRGTGKMDQFGTTEEKYLTKTNAILARGSSLEDLAAVSQRVADRMAPGDDSFAAALLEHVERGYADNKRIQTDNEQRVRSTMDSAIIKAQSDGTYPTSVLDLVKANPNVDIQSTWNSLSPADQRKYGKQFTQNAAGDRPPTDADWSKFQQLYGEAINRPADYGKEDLISTTLPLSLKSRLITQQLDIQKGQLADPQMPHALGVLKGVMDDAGITKDDQSDYDQFVGGLHDAMQKYIKYYGKQPDDNNIELMGNRLLKQTVGASLTNWWGDKLYQMPVPQADYDRIKNRATTLGYNLTDTQIGREYRQEQYQQLYGKIPSP